MDMLFWQRQAYGRFIQMVPRPENTRGLKEHFAEIEFIKIEPSSFFTRPACLQNLLHRQQEPIVVSAHYLVEFPPLFRLYITGEERVEVEFDRCNWRFKLVRYGVQEGVVLFVASDLTKQKDRVQRQTRDDQGKKDDAEDQQRDLADVQQDPPDIQRDSDDEQTDAKDQEENGRPPSPHC